MLSTKLRLLTASVTAAVVATLLLAGCAPTVSDPGPGGTPGTKPAGDAGADCSIFDGQTDPELILFTSSAITAGPQQGQKFGDGTTLSVTLSPEAQAAGLLPMLDLIALHPDGGPNLISSLAFDPTTGGDGTYSTKILNFGNDELVGTAIIAEIFAISDAPLEGTHQYGQNLLLGNYCITFANDGS